MKAPEPPRRSASNDGHRSQVGHVLPKIENAALYASCVEEHKRRAARIFNGPKAKVPDSRSRNRGANYLPDEQVLALRRLRDWCGLSAKAIAKLTGLSENAIAGIVEYRNRVHLDPGPRPAGGADVLVHAAIFTAPVPNVHGREVTAIRSAPCHD